MVNSAFIRSRATAKTTLMMISAKGGVGKSTMTVHLAAALAARGLKVGIFDADLHGPDIPALLGIRQKRDLNMMSPEVMMPVEVHPDSMDMRPIQPLERYGLKIMSLGLLVGEQQTLNPQPEMVGRIIVYLLARVDWGEMDVLLLDMPPGTGEPLGTLMSVGLVDGAVLIALRERLAHLDNGRLVSLLKREKMPIIGVVENMAHIICPKCGEIIEMYPAPAEDEKVYDGAPILGAIPFHPHLIRQLHSGPPVALSDPDSPVTPPLLALADAVMARVDALPKNGAHPRPKEDDCVDCP
jgi:ATP-binding protein involved in chromosome partitioning